MCKHNLLLRAVFVAPPTIPIFLALLRGVEDRLQPLGKEADDVCAAEVQYDILEELDLVAEAPTQDPIPEAHLGGQQAHGAEEAWRKGPPVRELERGAVFGTGHFVEELAVPPPRAVDPCVVMSGDAIDAASRPR